MGSDKNEGSTTDVESRQSQSSTLAERPHAMTARQIVQKFSSDPQRGLATDEAAARLLAHGRNALDDGPGVQPIKILINQVANAMMLVCCYVLHSFKLYDLLLTACPCRYLLWLW